MLKLHISVYDAGRYVAHMMYARISKCVRTYMSERVPRDYGGSLYAWNVTAGRVGYLGHTCLCSDDVTAT